MTKANSSSGGGGADGTPFAQSLHHHPGQERAAIAGAEDDCWSVALQGGHAPGLRRRGDECGAPGMSEQRLIRRTLFASGTWCYGRAAVGSRTASGTPGSGTRRSAPRASSYVADVVAGIKSGAPDTMYNSAKKCQILLSNMRS